jgi:imidazolonepropionase
MNLLIQNIKQLVTVHADNKPFKAGNDMCDLGVIEHATVLIQNGLFSWIGSSAEFSQTVDENIDVIDASDFVALPGFVDSHTHLLFAGSNENEFAMRSNEKANQKIAGADIKFINTVQATRTATKKELKKLARRHLDKMLQQGTTTVEIKSGYGLNEDDEIKMLNAINDLIEESLMDIVPTFFGARTIPPEFKETPDGYIDLICKRMLPYIAQRKLAKFCDAFCKQGHFSIEQCRRIFEKAKSLKLGIKINVDELVQNGALKLIAKIGATSVDHLERISDSAIATLKQSGTVATVLPGTSFFLHNDYPPARKIIDAGIPLAIASNFNPNSCMSYSMPLMMTIACTQMSLTPEEVITAATLNGAAALGLSDKLGSIELGKQADIVLFDVPNYRYLVYHFGINFAAKIIKRGTYLVF